MGDSMVVVLDGELDLANASELERRLDAAASGGQLHIDLGGVEFLDCAALSVIIAAAVRCRSAGGHVTLHRPRALVRHMIEVSGLTGAVAVADDPAVSASA